MKGGDDFVVGRKLHSIHLLMSQGTEAIAVQHGTNLVETNLLF